VIKQYDAPEKHYTHTKKYLSFPLTLADPLSRLIPTFATVSNPSKIWRN